MTPHLPHPEGGRASPGPVGKSDGRVWKVSLLVGLAVASYPTPFIGYGEGLDAGWIYAINRATADSLVYGRDFAFTFGPLGFVCFPDDVGNNQAIAAVARALLRSVWLLSVGLVVWPLPFWRAAAFAAGASLTAIPIYDYCVFNQDCIGTTLCCCVYLLVVAATRDRVWPAAAAAVVTGVAAVMKLNVGVACGGAVAGYCAAEVLTRGWRTGVRRLAVLVPTCGLTVTSLYVALGGGPGDLPGYIRSAMLIGDGYSSHVSISGAVIDLGLAAVPAELVVVAVFGVVVLASAAAALAQPSLVPVVLITAFPLFSMYKSAVVRCDSTHVFPAALTAVALLSTFVLRAATLRTVAGSVALAVVAAAILVDSLSNNFFVHRLLSAPATIRRTGMWAVGGDSRRAFAEAADEGIELSLFYYPYTPEQWLRSLDLAASYDVYPYFLTLVRDGGLKWRPRFVPQSYLAYHPRLDAASAETYRRPDAPDYVIFHTYDPVGYFPFAVDPLTLTELIRHYDLDRRLDHRFLLLRRRSAAGLGELIPAAQGVAGTGTPIPVPALGPNEIAFLSLQYNLSAYGRAASVVYRVESPVVTVRYADGTTADRVMGWRNAASGFLASHLPPDLDGAEAFLAGRDAARVLSLTPLPNPGFAPEIAYEWRKAVRK